jgi:DNA-binding XRE family transcriptional regulator
MNYKWKMKTTRPPRISKIIGVDGFRVRCLFSTGEYRVVDFNELFQKWKGKDIEKLKIETAFSGLIVENGTLTWPNIKKEIKLKSGKTFDVAYDLSPTVLYEESIVDEKMEQQLNIGPMLKRARKAAGLTQDQLAERIGTTKHYISRIENNRSDIEVKTLRRIVEIGLNKRLAIVD